jgi:tripartite-type tricarboxylate transporter receptor subunit TctC
VVTSASPDAVGSFIAAEITRWGELIRAAGITTG